MTTQAVPARVDRVLLGDMVAAYGLVPGGWVASRGELIAVIGQGASPPASAMVARRIVPSGRRRYMGWRTRAPSGSVRTRTW